MTQDKTDDRNDMPGIPDGMDDDRIVISEDEACVFCGAPLWKDLSEEEAGLEDRWFCTQYDLGEHEYEQRESVKEGFEFEDVSTGEVYNGSNHNGMVVVNNGGTRLSIGSYGMGGCSSERIDVVPRDVGIDTPDYIIFELESDPHV